MEPATAMQLLKTVSDLKKSLDAAALKKSVRKIEEALTAVQKTLEQDARTHLRAGYEHLACAVASTQKDVRRDELMQARMHFGLLVAKEDEGATASSETELSVTEIAALSHLGNYHYFILRNDPKLALLQAYACTEKFPALALGVFPAKLFTKDYAEAIVDATSDANKAEVATRIAQANYSRNEEAIRQAEADYYGYYWRRAAAVTKAAGVVTGGLAGLAIGNPLLLAAAGAKARQILEDGFSDGHAKPTRPEDPQTSRLALEDEISRKRAHEQSLKGAGRELLRQLAAEAQSRRNALEAEADPGLIINAHLKSIRGASDRPRSLRNSRYATHDLMQCP